MADSTQPGRSASDIPPDGWVAAVSPAIRPHLRLMRLDRPIGTWLLLLPGWWSIAMAASGTVPDGWLFALFGIGALVMRSAGCVVNDIYDRNFDRQVARTADRPIASGAVSVPQALLLLAGLLFIGLGILLQFKRFAIGLGAASLLLVFTYPLMKRITYWPQAFLGLTFNWGALLGWAAVTGALAPPALVLYAAGFFWTLGYDTIYAYQDKEDDALIGVKSTALLFGEASRRWIIGFYAVFAALLGLAGWLAGLGIAFHLGWALGVAHLGWQVWRLSPDDPAACLRLFQSNRDFGLIILAAIVAGQFIG